MMSSEPFWFVTFDFTVTLRADEADFGFVTLSSSVEDASVKRHAMIQDEEPATDRVQLRGRLDL